MAAESTWCRHARWNSSHGVFVLSLRSPLCERRIGVRECSLARSLSEAAPFLSLSQVLTILFIVRP